MSVDENGDLLDDDITVSDDEDYCDKKVKTRLLNTRELLIKSKTKLETERLIEPDVQYSGYEAFAAWANLIQSYIFELGILLEHDDIPMADYYREEIELGTVHLVPQDTEGVPFSDIVREDVTEKEIVQQSDALDRGCKLPRPSSVTFRGLMDVAETDILLEDDWRVVANPMEAEPNQRIIRVEAQQPVPTEIFQRALVASDQFLQNVGIGLDIEAEPYKADGEPGL